jgi:hypothetical protein
LPGTKWMRLARGILPVTAGFSKADPIRITDDR